ncbi:cyclic nucleotide-binding-like protein [Zopfochytrium polystomum]|nr:cyclic nucleotide-binding-like protein [Zopfochytrium polystomum]
MRIAAQMPAVAKYDVKVRKAMCRVIGYGMFEKGRVIVRQGHPAQYFYFVLSGQLEIGKQVDDDYNILGTLSPGESFGELASSTTSTARPPSPQRYSTERERTDTELLYIHKDDFTSVLRQQELLDLKDKEDFIASIPLFSDLPARTIRHLAAVCQTKELQANMLVFAEGDNNWFVHIIRKGDCRIVKYVPFAELDLDPKGARKVVVPYPLRDGFVPPFNYRVVPHFLRVANVSSGAHFGEVAAIAAMGSSQLGLALNFPGETRDLLTARFSLISNSRVRYLSISWVEFIRICTVQMAAQAGEKYLQDHARLLNIAALQEAFIARRHWNANKQAAVQQVLADGARRKRQ